jgi:hypothetical protein
MEWPWIGRRSATAAATERPWIERGSETLAAAAAAMED